MFNSAKLKLTTSGKVIILLREDEKILSIDHLKNNIMPGAYSILAQRLMNYNQALLNKVFAFKAGAQLGEADVYGYDYNPITNEVDVKATFSNASFDDTLDELRLASTGIPAEFAKLTNLLITKTGVQQLQIIWRIKIY